MLSRRLFMETAGASMLLSASLARAAIKINPFTLGRSIRGTTAR